MNLNININKAINFITEYQNFKYHDVLDHSTSELLESLDNIYMEYRSIFNNSKYYIESKNNFDWNDENAIYANIEDMENCISDLVHYALNIIKCEVGSYEL